MTVGQVGKKYHDRLLTFPLLCFTLGKRVDLGIVKEFLQRIFYTCKRNLIDKRNLLVYDSEKEEGRADGYRKQDQKRAYHGRINSGTDRRVPWGQPTDDLQLGERGIT